MQVQGMMRLVGFGLLAMLPTISGQANTDCTVGASECIAGRCCKDNGRCSRSDEGSIADGDAATDSCECASGFAANGVCAVPSCTMNDDCPGDTCCRMDGECSTANFETVEGGVTADDACECVSGLYFAGLGVCGCNNDGECTGDLCCKRNTRCSGSNGQSLAPGEIAEDVCECVSLSIDNPTNTCECTNTDQCAGDDVCCPETDQCEDPLAIDPSACGDPHMTGFLGQKFDFTGVDGEWYALISDLPSVHVNMRVTAPVPSLPEITYITGLSVLTTDADGVEHSMVISVKDPHSLESACPMEQSVCLADGALNVVFDGEKALVAPGVIMLAPGVQVTAANIPGECRSFGFEKYWEKKKLENAQAGRRLHEAQTMGDWILGDPTVTNMAECTEYVAGAMMGGNALFDHQSEHASFQIVTPTVTIRLSHGRLHQVAMRDPTDQYDLPDHLTWQMNMAIDQSSLRHDAQGILGETFVPTRDAEGYVIMHGMESIRGEQEDYYVDGPLGVAFAQANFSP